MKHMNVLNAISEIDVAIHNPARLKIIYLLSRNRCMDYTLLLDYTGLTSGNITTHLNKLAQVGYISLKKSFKGNKPNTSVKLTELGAKAYRNWGDNILKTLPEDTKQQLYEGIVSNIRLPKYGQLSYRDGYPYMLSEQAQYLMHGFYGKGLSLPPKEEACVW